MRSDEPRRLSRRRRRAQAGGVAPGWQLFRGADRLRASEKLREAGRAARRGRATHAGVTRWVARARAHARDAGAGREPGAGAGVGRFRAESESSRSRVGKRASSRRRDFKKESTGTDVCFGVPPRAASSRAHQPLRVSLRRAEARAERLVARGSRAETGATGRLAQRPRRRRGARRGGGAAETERGGPRGEPDVFSSRRDCSFAGDERKRKRKRPFRRRGRSRKDGVVRRDVSRDVRPGRDRRSAPRRVRGPRRRRGAGETFARKKKRARLRRRRGKKRGEIVTRRLGRRLGGR